MHTVDQVIVFFEDSCFFFYPFSGFSLQSRIMKHAGDLTAAAALADEARCMDLADRYINSECVKRMLQADQVYISVLFILYCFGRCPQRLGLNLCIFLVKVASAEKTAVLFTKEGDQLNSLHDMQCMWYGSLE